MSLVRGRHLAALSIMMLSAACTAAPYTAGDCVGVARTGRGAVKVRLVFTETALKSVSVLRHHETPGISDRARLEMPKRILSAQSSEVEVVSGATITSRAIRRAAERCFEKHRRE